MKCTARLIRGVVALLLGLIATGAQEQPAIPALARLDAQHEKAVSTTVGISYQAEFQRLRTAQTAALDAALKRVANAGQLDWCRALTRDGNIAFYGCP